MSSLLVGGPDSGHVSLLDSVQDDFLRVKAEFDQQKKRAKDLKKAAHDKTGIPDGEDIPQDLKEVRVHDFAFGSPCTCTFAVRSGGRLRRMISLTPLGLRNTCHASTCSTELQSRPKCVGHFAMGHLAFYAEFLQYSLPPPSPPPRSPRYNVGRLFGKPFLSNNIAWWRGER